jgi:hypothetical protein
MFPKLLLKELEQYIDSQLNPLLNQALAEEIKRPIQVLLRVL